MAGILIGGAMTASTLTGRRAYDELVGHFGSYEAALAIGLPAPRRRTVVIQPSAREALTPGLDQTRTVGLVTLPGAFVGVLLGGGTPLEAGAAQVLVLIGLLAVQSITCAWCSGCRDRSGGTPRPRRPLSALRRQPTTWCLVSSSALRTSR